MISVDNTDNVLWITNPGANGNGLSKEFYQFSIIKSVSWIKDYKDDYFVLINFIVGDVNSPLKIKMGTVDNQPGWTNDEPGAYKAVQAISIWMNPSSVIGNLRTANIYNASVSGATNAKCYSVSIANVGTANGTVNGAILTPGTTINFDGGAMNNQIDVISFDSNLTTFLITELA